MIFTELPEEHWPENFTYPQHTVVDSYEEFIELRNELSGTQHFYTGAPVMFIFADKGHVEFVDAYSGSLLFPPERFMISMFKSIARSKGPFVILAQYGFSVQGYYGEAQAVRDQEHRRRFFSPMTLLHNDAFSEYDFRTALIRRLAKKLNTRHNSSAIGIRNTRLYTQTYTRLESHQLTVLPDQHIYYMLETTNEDE